MEPREVFELLVRADEALKYATPRHAAARVRQARALVERALREAEALRHAGLVEQARRRLADLERLQAGGRAPWGPAGSPGGGARAPRPARRGDGDAGRAGGGGARL